MPRPSFESPGWEENKFDPSAWEDWYGAGARECGDVFDIYMHLQTNYQRAERRANGILQQDELDIAAVRDYVLSIYEQSEQGLVEEDSIKYGRDARGKRYTAKDVHGILNDLPRYGDAFIQEDHEPKTDGSRFKRFLEALGRHRIRFI